VSAPLLIVHGDADDVIPVEQARELADQARRQGLPAQLRTVPGLAHDSSFTKANWNDLWPEITGFLHDTPPGGGREHGQC
jgi:polyketide synthase 12